MADGSLMLEFTPEVEAATAPLLGEGQPRVTPMEWRAHAPLIAEINRLKREKNAVDPGPQLHDARDLPRRRRLRRRQPGPGPRGRRARTRKIIVQAGVHFMAETSKMLCPDKTVLIPDLRAGCSLAASITGGGRAADQAALSGPAGGHLRQHHRRGEGRDRHLLHQRQRRAGGRGGRPRVRAPTASSCCRTSSWPATSRARPTSGSSPGRAAARCTSASTPRTSPECATPSPTPRSWPTRNARPRCWSWPTSPARPRR